MQAMMHDTALPVRAAAAAPTRPGKLWPHQATIGLSLFALILSSWIAIHIYGVFFFDVRSSLWPLVPVIAAVQCWLTVGLFIVAHDAMHGSLAPFRPGLNRRIGALILMIYAGFSWKRVRDAHFAHHDAPGTEADPDFFTGDPSRFGPWYRTFFTRYFGIGSIAFVSTIVTIEIVLLGARVENVVLFYGLPSLASSVQLFYFGTYLPHRHEDEHEAGAFADAHNARSSEFGYLASLFTCFHFGYHHEHHLAPSVPWWALPMARAETRTQLAG